MKNQPGNLTLNFKLLTNELFSMVVHSADTISAVKQRIFEREKIPPIRQNLLVMGKVLQPDTRKLEDWAIKAGDTVYVTAGVRGPDAKPAEGLLLAAGAGGSGGVLASSGPSSAKQSGNKDTPMVFGYPVGGSHSPASALPQSPESDKKTIDDRGHLDPNAASPTAGSDPMPGTDVGKLRASTIQHYANVTTVLRPHADAAADPASTSRWPRQSQAYCVYTRKVGKKELTGIITFGLSNPYQNTFFFAIGVGIEILLECPTPQARLAGSNPNGQVTGATISDGWMFAVVHEIAHQCFALGLQIRQALEKLHLLSVEIAGVALPAEYIDQETGRCCVLLGHLGDPDVPRGFNVTVPHQHQWILQSVLFVPARVLTRAQCLAVRKDDGAEARKKIAEEFVKNKSYSVCDIPAELWPKISQPSTNTGESKSTASSVHAGSSAAGSASSAPAHASSSAATSAPAHASSSAASSATSAPAHASSSAAESKVITNGKTNRKN